jgi:IclR family pca regulon transcriptional regulator
MSPDERYFIEALRRGFNILEAFNEGTPWLSLVEIAHRVRLDKSTVFRFVYTLEELGYLERNPDTKKYRPGLKILTLGFTTLNSLGLAELARPHLRALFEECGETTNMAVRDGAEIVYVARISSQEIISVNLSVGSRLPVHCTSMGKAQLLDMTHDDLLDLLGPGPYEQVTKKTITTPDGLIADLEKSRKRGYTLNNEELVIGLRSVGVPIRDANSQIVAAINIAAPDTRLNQRELKSRFAPLAVETGQQISAALGARTTLS